MNHEKWTVLFCSILTIMLIGLVIYGIITPREESEEDRLEKQDGYREYNDNDGFNSSYTYKIEPRKVGDCDWIIIFGSGHATMNHSYECSNPKHTK